jgi:hypothetical protein
MIGWLMNLQDVCAHIERDLESLFEELRSGISQREDSRAFGAMIEKRITENWIKICRENGYDPMDIPGRRTIFDFAFKLENKIMGIDVKTKDLDSQKYSDGGICAIGNLFKFLANDKGEFLIAEFGHNKSSSTKDTRDIEYIRVAPFTVLPVQAYRIENLGTGQIRLNYTLNQIWDEIEWSRSTTQFFDYFSDLAIKHYQRVGRDAESRIRSIEKFREGGYQNFKFTK